MDLKSLVTVLQDQWYEVFKSDPEENLYIREMLSNEQKN